MKKKILYVASRFPWPSTGGREFMILQSLEALSREAQVSLAYFETADVTEKDLKSFSSNFDIDVLCKLPVRNLFLSVLFSLINKVPFQYSMFSWEGSKKILYKLLGEENYDIVFFDMLRTSGLVDCVKKATVVLEMDDLLSIRYARQRDSKHGNPLGGRAIGVLGRVVGLLSVVFGRWTLNRESKILEKMEIAACKRFDVVTLTSPTEAASLSRRAGVENVFSFPPSYKQNFFSSKEYIVSSDCIFGFVGNLCIAHNMSSVRFVLEKILPLADKFKDVNFTFEVLGKIPASQVPDFRVPNNVKVIFRGFVPEFDQFLSRWCAMLCPISYGSGIKLKILDAMRLGVPVVTNFIGAEGIPLSEAEEIFVENDCEAMFSKVLLLHSDSKLRQSKVESAFALMTTYFDLEVNRERYLRGVGLLVT